MADVSITGSYELGRYGYDFKDPKEGSEQVKAEDGLVPYRGWSHTLGGNVVYRPESSGLEFFGGLGFRFENGAPNKVADLLGDNYKGIFDEATPSQDTSVEGGETSPYPCDADGDLKIEEGEVCEEGSEVSVDDATSDIDTSDETVEIGSFGLRFQAGVAYSFEAIPDTLIVRPEAAIFYGGGWYNGAEGHGRSLWDYAEYESRLIDFKSYTEPGVRVGVGAAFNMGKVSDKLDNIALALNGGWNGSLRKVEGQYRQTGNFADPQHTFVSELFVGTSLTVPLGGRGGSRPAVTPATGVPGAEAEETEDPAAPATPAGAEAPPPTDEEEAPIETLEGSASAVTLGRVHVASSTTGTLISVEVAGAADDENIYATFKFKDKIIAKHYQIGTGNKTFKLALFGDTSSMGGVFPNVTGQKGDAWAKNQGLQGTQTDVIMVTLERQEANGSFTAISSATSNETVTITGVVSASQPQKSEAQKDCEAAGKKWSGGQCVDKPAVKKPAAGGNTGTPPPPPPR